MSTVKKYGLSGVDSPLELGKGGPTLVNNGGAVEHWNNGGLAMVAVRGADPVGEQDFVTKHYLETEANVIAIGEVYGSGVATFFPVSLAANTVYLCTQTVGTFAINNLYYYDGSTWTAITPFAGMRIAVTINLTRGTITYGADYIYLWDATAAAWTQIGPINNVTKVVKTVRYPMVYNSGSSFNIGSAVPVGAMALRAIVSVTTPFNGTTPTLTLGDTGVANSIMTVGEVNLAAAGIYVADCYNSYPSGIQLTGAYAAGSSTAGAASIEIEYSIQ